MNKRALPLVLNAMDPDLDLLTRYHHGGDAGAFQALVTAHAGMVYAAARRVTQNAALAEEVAQDTFLALACRGQLVRESVAAWLHHVARQKACNALRGERRRQRAEQSVPPEESEASWAEIEPLLDEAIDGLPERLRGLVIGHFLEQRTQQEMARRLGWSQATVSRQIGTALQALRDGLKRKGVMCGLGLAGLLNARTVHAAPPSLTASLGKTAAAGAGSTAAASSLIAMTTTTKLCLATAAIAGTWLFVPHHAPAPAPPATPPATGILAETCATLTREPAPGAHAGGCRRREGADSGRVQAHRRYHPGGVRGC